VVAARAERGPAHHKTNESGTGNVAAFCTHDCNIGRDNTVTNQFHGFPPPLQTSSLTVARDAPAFGLLLQLNTQSRPSVLPKNGVFWDIEPKFVLHRRHITSPLQSPVGY
jgi:hypothetical protein